MHVFRILGWIFCLCTLGLMLIGCSPPESGPSGFRFAVSFPGEVHSEAITGRVYVILSRDYDREPRFQTGFTGVPIWGKNVSALNPGEEIFIDDRAVGYPLRNVTELPAGDYYVQAFVNVYSEFKRADGHTIWLHDDQWEGQRWNMSPGNLYSDVKKIRLNPARRQTIHIPCGNVIPPVEVPPDTEWVQRIKFKSRLLSEFWGRPIYLGATVLLPKGYHDHPEVSYPVDYIQGHFSLRAPNGFRTDDPGPDNPRAQRGYEFYKYWISDCCPRMILVTFQHPCPYFDDSYAVNSANVGPYGDALMQELIPAVEERFRIIRKPYARMLSGGSTGGWESLALQIFHPEFFGGTFSTCPDPVDFRYYQIVNIYEDENAYFTDYDWKRVERPYARTPDGGILYMMKDRQHYELVIGDKNRSGGQMAIWEAVYSPVGEDGYPRQVWDWETGEIDHETAELWRPYDLRHYLEENWSRIGSQLEGKLHIYTGDMDTYYLNCAVVLLEEFLENTSDPYYAGEVKYGDRAPHCWGIRGRELMEAMARQIMKNAPSGEDTSAWNYR